jgi:hypothetical protein
MIVKNIHNKYLICNTSFGPFEEGSRFYCTLLTNTYFYVLSENCTLGVDKFKIHIDHLGKFTAMS